MKFDTRVETWVAPDSPGGGLLNDLASRATLIERKPSGLQRSATEHRPLSEAGLGLAEAGLSQRSSPAVLALAMKRTPQALPIRQNGERGCESLKTPVVSSIRSSVSVATFLPAGDDSPDADEPTLQVGEWVFHGCIKTIYDGSAGLSNSCVKMGRAHNCSGAHEDMLVAVKTVALDSDEDSVKMIRRERAILSELGDGHPHVLPMLYFAETASDLVMLTRFAPGGDLASYMPRNVPVEEMEVAKLTQQLLSALSHLHSLRIVHGDIKPQNVFLTELDVDGMLAQVSDFGLSAKIPDGEDHLHVGGVQGSYGFVPSEVISEGRLGFEADLFALGVMVFRYLGGHDPFFPPSKVNDAVEFDPGTWAQVSPVAREFALQLLSPRPQERGTSSALCAHAWLQQVVEDEPRFDALARFATLAAARTTWERGGLA